MTFAELVGFVGVFFLLAALFLNLVGVLGVNSLAYVCLNLRSVERRLESSRFMQVTSGQCWSKAAGWTDTPAHG